MRPFLYACLLCLAFTQTAFAQTKALFEVLLEEIPQVDQRVLYIDFYDSVPAPEVVDKIIRNVLEAAVALDGSKDITTVPYLNDDNLKPEQYSGALSYDSKQKKIFTVEERLKNQK